MTSVAQPRGGVDRCPHRPLQAAAWARLAVAVGLAGGASVGMAMAVSGPGGTAEQASRIVIAAPVAGVNTPTLGLVAARIDAVDAAATSITVRGKPVPLHSTQLRVLGPGGKPLGGPRALRAGMQVRFALEPEAATPAAGPASIARAGTVADLPARRIVLIYVDAAP